MGWITVYTVATKQGDFVGNRYTESQALRLMKTCDHTRPENSPHQMRTWHNMDESKTINFIPPEAE
jgi:hypothetical protein